MKSSFEIKELSPLNVVTCPHRGEYMNVCEAFKRLSAWAEPRGLMEGEPRFAAIYHDDPDTTAVADLRSDACLVVAEDVAVDGEISKHTIAGGLFAVGHFEIHMSEFPTVWHKTYEYLKSLGYACGDGDHYELYLQSPACGADDPWVVDVCVPVKK